MFRIVSLVTSRARLQVVTTGLCLSDGEYRALASTTCVLQWLTLLLGDLHIDCSRLAALYCDN